MRRTRRPSPIEAVAITNQRETAAAWDRTTGVPIVNAISWQCRRSSDICAALATQSDFINQTTGLPLDPLLSATKWSWLLQHDVDLKLRASAGEICFGTIDNWLLYKLTSGAVYATDHSNASRTALLNLQSLDWDPLLNSGNVFSASERASLATKGAVGDICLQYFNSDGELIPTLLADRVIGIKLQQLKRIKHVIGIAGGRRKVDAIRGALTGRWINVLVTDRATARAVLDRKSRP